MIAAQYQFMPTMIQSAAYNCSAVMPIGHAWADQHGKKQILYIPCLIALCRDMRSSCIKIMFCLSFLDMIAVMANCIIFGYLLLKGTVYCSNPVVTLAVGIVGYFAWCTASSLCVVLAISRLFEVLGLTRFVSSTRTKIYIGMCCAYGLFMMFFTRPVIFNSQLQYMFFSSFIPGHSFDEYVYWPHAVHNIVVTINFVILYMTLRHPRDQKRMMLFRRTMYPQFAGLIRTNPDMFYKIIQIFAQALLISCVNLVAASIYVFMNFIPVPPFVIVLGQAFCQLSHASPPYIYLALNKSIRRFVFESIGLGAFYTHIYWETIMILFWLLQKNEDKAFTTTQGLPSISVQIDSRF